MRIVPPVVPLACVALALGLSACGGGDSEPEATPATTQQEPATTEAAPTTTEAAETTTTAEAGGVAGGATKPGTTLKLGETAHVTREPLDAPADSKAFYELDVAVLKIEKGTQADFVNVDLDADQKKATPYYVTLRIANTGRKSPFDDDPALGFDGIDDRGQSQGRVIFLGTFERCDYADTPEPFTKGKSYETCLVFLIPGGGSIQQVQWTGSDAYFSEPVTWK